MQCELSLAVGKRARAALRRATSHLACPARPPWMGLVWYRGTVRVSAARSGGPEVALYCVCSARLVVCGARAAARRSAAGSVRLALEGSDPEGQLYGPPAADQSGSMSARVDIGPRGPIRQ